MLRIMKTQRANLPAIGTVVQVEHSVLLLQTEPRLVLGMSLHELDGLMAVVVLVGRAISIPALGEDKDVLPPTERVWEDGDGLQVNIRVVTGSLSSRRAVKVPGREVLRLVTVLLLREGLSRWSRSVSAHHQRGWEHGRCGCGLWIVERTVDSPIDVDGDRTELRDVGAHSPSPWSGSGPQSQSCATSSVTMLSRLPFTPSLSLYRRAD